MFAWVGGKVQPKARSVRSEHTVRFNPQEIAEDIKQRRRLLRADESSAEEDMASDDTIIASEKSKKKGGHRG
jgi:hypothetical protein